MHRDFAYGGRHQQDAWLLTMPLAGMWTASRQKRPFAVTGMQVGPSFFDAPGAAVAEMPGRNSADYHDVDITIVFCSGCQIKVRQLSRFPPDMQASWMFQKGITHCSRS